MDEKLEPLEHRARIAYRPALVLGQDTALLRQIEAQEVHPAMALAQGTPLVTHNRQHFERIPGLLIDDWLT